MSAAEDAGMAPAQQGPPGVLATLNNGPFSNSQLAVYNAWLCWHTSVSTLQWWPYPERGNQALQGTERRFHSGT